jgi:pilus assembly protein Flp/PilA
MWNAVIRFVHDRKGATSIEYAMIASGIAVVIVVAVMTIGGQVNLQFIGVSNALR